MKQNLIPAYRVDGYSVQSSDVIWCDEAQLMAYCTVLQPVSLSLSHFGTLVDPFQKEKNAQFLRLFIKYMYFMINHCIDPWSNANVIIVKNISYALQRVIRSVQFSTVQLSLIKLRSSSVSGCRFDWISSVKPFL